MREEEKLQPNPLIGEGTYALIGNKSAKVAQKQGPWLALTIKGDCNSGKGVMRVLFTRVHTTPRI